MKQSEFGKPWRSSLSRSQQQQSWIQKQQLDAEEAETANVTSLDKRDQRKHISYEKPSSIRERAYSEGSPRFKDIARRARMMKQVSEKRLGTTQQQQKHHQQNKPKDILAAKDLLEAIHPNTDFFNRFNRQNPLYQSVGIEGSEISEGSEEEDEEEEEEDNKNVVKYSISDDTETSALPILSQTSYGSLVAAQVQQRRTRSIRRKRNGWNWFQLCNLQMIKKFLWEKVVCSSLVLLGFPLFIGSAIFFYCFGNPILPYHNIPGKITISWMLNFIGRQIVTLELSRMIQWIVLDCFVSGKKIAAAKFLGPHVTLVALHARGLPFILTTWSLLDMILLRGTSDFHIHWMYWTGWKIYTEGNSGSHILSSNLYLRMLLAMILLGSAMSLKRAAVAIRFGKRLLADFKPRMELLLADIVLMNEIAALSDQIESAVEDYDPPPTASSTTTKDDFEAKGTESKQSPGNIEEGLLLQRHDSAITEETITWSSEEMKPGMIARGESTALPDLSDNAKRNRLRRVSEFEPLKQTSSRGLAIKDFLDQWEDPVKALKNKQNQEATIEDVLKFRRALAYMDESHPFGQAFGPARDRDEALESSHKVFYKLTKLNDEDVSDVVNFDVLAIIANDENGKPNPDKLVALRKLFRPDARNELPLLAFIQSCDFVYKRLRYFRASVSNSSAIDEVLETMVNAVFWFILSMFVLEVMNFDPWTIVLSSMSLLVSVSFALGPSVSQFVEGLLLIAARRPFDLGDRIMILGSESQEKPSPTESYFVEDISLLKTTIRYARTNEVSSISNFSISKSRIINLQRSVNAVIPVEMKFKISEIFSDDKYSTYRSILEHYVEENPRIWDCLAFMRHDEFDPDLECVTFRFGFRHRNSWQQAARIMLHRADLLRFMYEQAKELCIHFTSPIPQRCIFDGGTFENHEYRKNKDIEEEPSASTSIF